MSYLFIGMKEVDIFVEKFPHSVYCKQRSIKVPSTFIRRFFRRMINDRKATSKYSLSGKSSDYFYHISEGDSFGKKTTFLGIWISALWKKGHLDSIIQEGLNFSKKSKSLELCISYNKKTISYLESIGFVHNGGMFLGDTKQTLEYLSQYDFCSEYKIKKLDTKGEKKLVELIYISHSNSKTSFAKEHSKKSAGKFIKMCRENKYQTFILYHHSKMVGAITPIKSSLGFGHIMDISVHPDYQGLGLSKFLYYKAMNYFKGRKIDAFTGASRSDEVVSFAKKLKRKKIGYFMQYEMS